MAEKGYYAISLNESWKNLKLPVLYFIFCMLLPFLETNWRLYLEKRIFQIVLLNIIRRIKIDCNFVEDCLLQTH